MTNPYLFITFFGRNQHQVTVAVERDELCSVTVSRDDDEAWYYKTDGVVSWGPYVAKKTRLVPVDGDRSLCRREVVEDEQIT